ELRPPFARNAVVLAPPARLRAGPFRRDESLAFEPMQHGIEHPVGPLQMAAGELGDALDDRVAVAIAFREDREDERRRRRGDKVLPGVHTEKLYTLRFYV